MKLHEILKLFVDNNDAGILYEEKFVNRISDLYPNAFQPSSLKKILKYVIDEDYAIRVIDSPDKKLELTIKRLTDEIVKRAGYSEIYTSYILRCIAYAIGYNVNLKESLLELELDSDKEPTPYINNNHLYFKDVKIFGSAKSFVDEMCKKGYSVIDADCSENNYMLAGSYAGIQSKLMVQISPMTHQTSRIMVIYDDKIYNNWPALKALYFNLKDNLTKKYGKPTSSTEAFFPPYKDGCGKEIKLLDENKGAYQTKYNVDGGEIRLVIMSGARVIIAFMDAQGCIELNREFEEAAQNDM